MKKLYFAVSFALIISFNACSDNAQDKAKKQTVQETSSNTPNIEIVQNSDAKAVKVKRKVTENTEGNSYYYDYGRKNNSAAKARSRTKIDANLNVRSPYEEIQVSMLVKKLSKNFIVRCSPCHNDYANGIIGPSLLGRDANYIYSKIQEFKSGKKSNPLMRDLIKMMSDTEIKDMADEIYSFNKEIKAMRKK
jgi:cytochrome c553